MMKFNPDDAWLMSANLNLVTPKRMIKERERIEEDRLKHKLEIYKLAYNFAIDHCMANCPFPIDYKHGDLEDPWDKAKWKGWFESKANVELNK